MFQKENKNIIVVIRGSDRWTDGKRESEKEKERMYMWVEKIIKYSLFLRQCKVYQPARSQRKKGAKKKKKKKRKKEHFKNCFNLSISLFWYRSLEHPVQNSFAGWFFRRRKIGRRDTFGGILNTDILINIWRIEYHNHHNFEYYFVCKVKLIFYLIVEVICWCCWITCLCSISTFNTLSWPLYPAYNKKFSCCLKDKTK